MNSVRREVLNGLFVLVVASLLSAAFAALQVKFDIRLWVWILIGVSVAVSGYVIFAITLKYLASTEIRETEWLKRVGTPARLWSIQEGFFHAIKTISPGSDYTVMYYY